MMKRIIMISLFVLLLIGCTDKQQESDNPDDNMGEVTGKHVLELERTACNAADKAGTCDTRLPSLGFITKEECCEKYKKCC